MNETIQVREAHPDDWQFIADGNAAMALESEGKTLCRNTVDAGVKAALADPSKGRYFIAEVDGVPAGQTMVTLEWSDWRNGFFWWIQSVYVPPEFRRRGVFRAIHAYIRTAARAGGGVCGLRLYVERDNTTAIRTYDALGMSDAGYALLEEDWSGGANCE